MSGYWACEICARDDESLGGRFRSAWSYYWHLSRAHPPGALSRIVEPSLLGGALTDKSPPLHPRVWDRWDQGGRSGRVTRAPVGDLPPPPCVMASEEDIPRGPFPR